MIDQANTNNFRVVVVKQQKEDPICHNEKNSQISASKREKECTRHDDDDNEPNLKIDATASTISSTSDKCSESVADDTYTINTDSSSSLDDNDDDNDDEVQLLDNEKKEEEQLVQNNGIKKISSVQFSTVEIREYQQCIGDSPAVVGGPPISITWEYHNQVKYSLNEYEEKIFLQQQCGKEKRREDELIIPRHVREMMLINAGYSKEEILQTIREVNITHDERRHTKETLFLAGIEEWFENIYQTFIGNPIRMATYNILRNNKNIQHLIQCEELCYYYSSTLNNVAKIQ